jgi:hypothetical protein
MRSLASALEVAEAMRRALETEVVRAREQRALIRKMDADGLLLRAERRAAFNTELAALELRLAEALRGAAEELGASEVTFDALAARAPRETAAVTSRLDEVRALAAALRELDGANRALAERALVYVRGHLGALVPKSAAYDRRGAATAEADLSTSSRTA